MSVFGLRERNIMKDSKYRAFSVKNLLITFACIAIIGASSFSIYLHLMERAKINNTLNQIATLINNTYSIYNWRKPYDGLGNMSAVQMGILPRDMIVSPLVLQNPFHGDVHLSSVSNGEGFAILYGGLPPKACNAIASTDWGHHNSSGLKYLMISPSGYLMPKFFPERLSDGEYDSSNLPLKYEETSKHCICNGSKCAVLFFFQ